MGDVVCGGEMVKILILKFKILLHGTTLVVQK